MDPNHFRLTAALFLAATGLLLTAGAGLENQVTTCVFTGGDPTPVHRLACNYGVISVIKTLSGRINFELCAQVKPDSVPAKTHCSWPEAAEFVETRCDGMTSCEVDLTRFRNPGPCVGTGKYLHTTFTCVEALTVVVCEDATAQFQCDSGRVISIYSAVYGRRDQTTCSYRISAFSRRNVDCVHPVTALVAQRCDGQSSCSVRASNAVFTDPCVTIYKYLEISYGCNLLTPEDHDEDVIEAVLPCALPSV